VRGDVYRLRAPRARGHEQARQRYAVVVQSDDLFSSTVLVAPTSRSARDMRHRPRVMIDGEWTHVLVEQTTAVDPVRLGELAGRLSLSDMQEIDGALRDVFDL
jgi:mRNA interferase MazF